MTTQHPIKNRNLELGVGVALFVLGAYLVQDAYEGRNRKRPFASKLLLP